MAAIDRSRGDVDERERAKPIVIQYIVWTNTLTRRRTYSTDRAGAYAKQQTVEDGKGIELRSKGGEAGYSEACSRRELGMSALVRLGRYQTEDENRGVGGDRCGRGELRMAQGRVNAAARSRRIGSAVTSYDCMRWPRLSGA
jgi:hypothetical protein